MPELPEVETIRRFLEASVLGQPITSLEILNPASFDGNPDLVSGQTVTCLSRTGKQLSAYLSNGLVLLFHLKMTGQLIYLDEALAKAGLEGDSRTALGHPTNDMHTTPLPNKSTRVIFRFPSSTLYFNDQRKFGWIKVFSPDTLAEFQRGLGIDVLDNEFTLGYFRNQLKRSSRPVKSVLLDQDKYAGIGNIYANDALYLAKINPLNPASGLTSTQIKKLHTAVVSIINESIAHGGSSTKDKMYLRPDGSLGGHQYYFRVYQRAGETCSVCGSIIERLKVGGRGTFFCPGCQKP